MRGTLSWHVAAIAAFVFLANHVSLAQYGFWTSQDRSVGNGTVSMPTALGRSQGFTTTVGPLNTNVVTAPDFGFWKPVSAPHQFWNQSFFTPTALVVQYAQSMWSPNFLGNLLWNGGQFGYHIGASFHLDQSSNYSFGDVIDGPSLATLGLAPLAPAPVLSGPGGQTITLSSAQTGTLAPGDWQFNYDFQMVYPNTYPAPTPDGVTASFQLTIPEPSALIGLCVACAIAMLRRDMKWCRGPFHLPGSVSSSRRRRP